MAERVRLCRTGARGEGRVRKTAGAERTERPSEVMRFNPGVMEEDFVRLEVEVDVDEELKWPKVGPWSRSYHSGLSPPRACPMGVEGEEPELASDSRRAWSS